MSNRKLSQEFILSLIDNIVPGGENRAMYEEKFKNYTDKDYDNFIKRLESGEEFLVVTVPNFGKSKISVQRNIAIAKKLGIRFYQRVWVGKKGNSPEYLTPEEYPILDLPLRRASQLLVKKMTVPENNKVIDRLTGQPTKVSSKASISYTELELLASMGLDNSITELMKYRGGDTKGFNAMVKSLSRYGRANLDVLKNYAGGVGSTEAFKAYLTAAHLKSTL